MQTQRMEQSKPKQLERKDKILSQVSNLESIQDYRHRTLTVDEQLQKAHLTM